MGFMIEKTTGNDWLTVEAHHAILKKSIPCTTDCYRISTFAKASLLNLQKPGYPLSYSKYFVIPFYLCKSSVGNL